MNVTLPEKEKLKRKYIIIYGAIITFCVISLLIAFYVQFYARIDIAKLVGINQEVRFGNKTEEEKEQLKIDFLKVFNKSFLICSDDVKLSEISGYYDYVITSKDSGNIENFKTDTVIISSYEDNYLKIAKRFDDIANKYIATIGKGDIIININEDKEIIRRGYNGWNQCFWT